jgi:hypothetical protein
MAACYHVNQFYTLQKLRQYINIVILKSEVLPIIGHEGPEDDSRYSSTHTLTSALDGVGGERHALATLLREGDPLLTVQDALSASGLVWMGAENLAPTKGSNPGPSSP